MPHWLECCLNGYLVVAAIGFPICLPWALQNHQDMNANYKIGFENGQASVETTVQAEKP